jgi:GDPmannose 4,6-dehydratase
MFALSGILFNHESELRGDEFVTRKISLFVAKFSKDGSIKPLELGNIDAKRDWGYAKEYVEGMWAIMNHNTPDTFVLATGVTNTIRYFVEHSFKVIGIDIVWEGKGTDEVGKDKKTGKIVVKINPIWYRPAEVELLHGDPSKANKELGWKANVMSDKLAEIMVKSDINNLTK